MEAGIWRFDFKIPEQTLQWFDDRSDLFSPELFDLQKPRISRTSGSRKNCTVTVSAYRRSGNAVLSEIANLLRELSKDPDVRGRTRARAGRLRKEFLTWWSPDVITYLALVLLKTR